MSRPAMRKREGWRRVSQPGDKCSARWLHEASGWVVEHCGHPTANYPYFAFDPESADICLAQNGRAFPTLLDACESVDALVARRRTDRLGTVVVAR